MPFLCELKHATWVVSFLFKKTKNRNRAFLIVELLLRMSALRRLVLRGVVALGVKIPSSGPKKRKQQNLARARSQYPSPHPPSSRDGDGAQNTTVLACCMISGAHARVWARSRVRGVQIVCLRTMRKSRKRNFGVAAPCVSVFPCFSDSEMTARPSAADSEDEFKVPPSDVPLTLRKTSAKRQHLARGPSAPPVVEVGLVWPFSAVPGPI